MSFIMNAWYCAGWDYQVTQGSDSIVARKIAGKRLVLYRKPGGELVVMDDQCPHRQAALSLGRKEGDSIRCMYHGLLFDAGGQCIEAPGQDRIPRNACVRTYPVTEKDNWIWVWMGESDRTDDALIPDAVGPGHLLQHRGRQGAGKNVAGTRRTNRGGAADHRSRGQRSCRAEKPGNSVMRPLIPMRAESTSREYCA